MTTAQGGGKVVSLTHRPHLPPVNPPGTHFCQRLSRPQGHSAIGRIMSMKNSNDTNWDRTSDLPIFDIRICSVDPVAHSVQRLTTGWTVRRSNSGGARFSTPVQTGPGVHTASCTMGTGSFPGVKNGRGVLLTPHPFQCRGHGRVELYLYVPSGPQPGL